MWTAGLSWLGTVLGQCIVLTHPYMLALLLLGHEIQYKCCIVDILLNRKQEVGFASNLLMFSIKPI
jgi:hypothetical protein